MRDHLPFVLENNNWAAIKWIAPFLFQNKSNMFISTIYSQSLILEHSREIEKG